MVKLYALAIYYKGPAANVNSLASSFDLSSFNFFQRSSVQEFMTFISKTLVQRTQAAARQSVKQDEYTGHVYVRADNLAGVLLSDQEYPNRVAHTLLTKVLDEFTAKIPPGEWSRGDEANIVFPDLPIFLSKYQNPREADAMTRIQEELDETKIILHNTIEAVLERGEKIDDLVSKSEDLTIQSRAFYKTARKTNSCCTFG